MKDKIKVLVVDDSAATCAVLSHILKSDQRFDVVGQAADPYEAREKIKQLNPDVLTLDVEMPKMDGLTFLKNLMRLRPMPVVMISTLTQKGAHKTLECLEAGAIDYLGKPECNNDKQLNDYATQIVRKVFAAATANVRTVSSITWSEMQPLKSRGKMKSNFVCAIGASTGGTEAIKSVLVRLPENTPPIVVAQHIPKSFSSSFARRLDSCCAISVLEAEDGMPLEKNTAYIAPGDDHLIVARGPNGKYICKLKNTEPVNRHRPSVDVLFNSVANVFGKKSMGILLTGMGKDGAEGLLNLRKEGAYTLAQNEASSVVWGMPGAAVEIGAAEDVLSLDKISQKLLDKSFVLRPKQ